jgi:methylmalonyl-CoA mutase cobalamin-binding subunit
MKVNGLKIWGCTLGNCIHVAGIHRFLQLAEESGYQTVFAGVGWSVEAILEAVAAERPDFVALSYRLTPQVAAKLFAELATRLREEKLVEKTVWLCGGTPPVCRAAEQSGIFAITFDGTENEAEVRRWLQGKPHAPGENSWGRTFRERIALQEPYPIIRHHFGLPDLEETVRGVAALAESKALDVISIGPDQNAQQFFFRPEAMDPAQQGAGGVPLRRPEDLGRLYRAAQTGNYPLLRIYSGTQDLLQWAELSVRELHNAWAAIPLFWYSALDGRSERPLETAIRENQAAMAWYAQRQLPVEVNDAHQWSLRGAADEVAVAAAYLAAFNAKAQGVNDFILQLMWNTPAGIAPAADLAKMLAKLEIVGQLADDGFRIWREVRAGLASLAPQPAIAKGQLAASTLLSLQVRPHIVHVVGFCEGDHAATPAEIVESCQIVQGVIRDAWQGMPDMRHERSVLLRKRELLDQALRIIEAVAGLSQDQPLTDPGVLAAAVRRGILTAPQLLREPEPAQRRRTG